nr:integrase, catalytic region, zinc finger, CCHC-type, peptidase aspartic, catalytic [Tanacetum cinerariifolium]
MAGSLFIMFRVDRIEDRGTMQGEQVQLGMGELKTELGMQIQVKQGGQNNVVNDDVDDQPVQDLALNVDNVFQADECDVFDYDVDEAPTAQTMFMANLSSADPVYDEAGPSYDSDILFEVHDHDNYQDAVCELYEVHKMHDHVQPNCVVDSDAKYTSDSNMIPYDQIVIIDRNIKEANLKKELRSVKMQLNSTINHNNLMVEEVMSFNKDFKQKENKYLKDFLDKKALKEKVEDKLFKQDQSLQVHMLCKPKPHYDEQRKEIVKPNHACVLVHDSEDTLEIAETTKNQMNEKIKDPECVKKKDLIKMKAEALKEQTLALRPIKALMVYPLNTPATLVPR